jgi:hypothetical protein
MLPFVTKRQRALGSNGNSKKTMNQESNVELLNLGPLLENANASSLVPASASGAGLDYHAISPVAGSDSIPHSTIDDSVRLIPAVSDHVVTMSGNEFPSAGGDALVPVSPGLNRAKFMASGGLLEGAAVQSGAVAPVSPGANRARFMANCQPMKVCCDLATVGLHSSASRFSFQAIILIVYPASEKPDRRHLQLIDSRGSTGVTVWGEHVSKFSSESVGQVVRFSKLTMISNSGIKSLSMCRDSNVSVLEGGVASDESLWWSSLLLKPAMRIINVHDVEDNSIVTVSGIVGSLSTETKKVKNAMKDLLNIRITDRTGFIDIRSWNHSESELAHLIERPVMFKRVRVTSFAGLKILELLEGSGTEVVTKFDGECDLLSYWAE